MPERWSAAAHTARRWVLLAGVVCGSACDGPQSALVAAGREADRVAELWWWLAAGALLVWLAVSALLVFSVLGRGAGERTASRLIVAGAVAPVIILGALLAYGLSMIPDLTESAPPGSLRIEVSGEEWWWRVRYEMPSGEMVETANEIRLPVGEPVEFILTSPDVIHAFWVPSLGGKRDMIPGRENRLVLEATRTGTFAGACAEYCGTSHAHMNLDVVVLEGPAFAAWLAEQAMAARAPAAAEAVRGRELFVSNGCGACHTIRGTPADGRVGPDLTHMGSRLRIAAGTLPGDAQSIARWIANPAAFKPDARMPAFGMLPDADVRALAEYLSGLQ
jgi:cytochrome c oxidase subunit 2